MANSSILQKSAPAVQTLPLVCRINRKDIQIRGKVAPLMAELELENVSGAAMEIRYQMDVLQYLNLVIADSQGKVVSEGHFGDRFSPFDKERSFQLAAGESYRANIHLLATKPRGWSVPAGPYTVQAIYEYGGFRAESEPVEVKVA